MQSPDRAKTLEQLEGSVWPHDNFGSHVVQESQRLRKVSIGELSVEGLRLLIGQKIGLPFLVPIALEHVENNPFVESAFYRGDLLTSLLAVPEAFWAEYPELNNRVVELAVHVHQVHELLVSELLPALQRFQYR